jgi:ketosteroid isomerase-like protein
MQAPPEHEKSTDIDAARAVLIEVHAAIDRGEARSALGLFTPDAHFEARGRVLQGTDEIARFLADREQQVDRQTFHLIANESVLSTTADEVELGAFLLVHVRGRDGRYTVDSVLDTRHVLRREATGWLIARRTLRPLHPNATPN